jgi:coenzyme Q-binding protein COQ10
MPVHIEQADLPYAPQQVFDLVADIESYPKFLRHVAAARISRRDGNTLWVDQVVQFKMLRLKFSTKAVLEPPRRIHIVCSDSTFGTFDDQWSFADWLEGGTHLQCRTEFQFKSNLVRIAMDATLGDVLKTTVQAFQSRARQLYGKTVPSAT